jgi:hypothetical protein
MVYHKGKKYITDIDGNIIGCCLCGAEAEYDEYEERFIFSCPCGEIDLDLLPDQYK